MLKSSEFCLTHTPFGAGSKTIRALVITPNWPKPPNTAKNSSEFLYAEQVTTSPFPDESENTNPFSSK